MKKNDTTLSKKNFGNQGERLVQNYLVKKGFTILASQYALHRYGEIDIVAQYQNIIVFVEVKSRKKNLASLSELISHHQKVRITKIALYYCLKHNIAINENMILRFDVALVVNEIVDYYENAFTAN